MAKREEEEYIKEMRVSLGLNEKQTNKYGNTNVFQNMTIENEITCTKCHVTVLSFRLEPPYETTDKRLHSLRVLRNSRIIPSQLYSALSFARS